MANIIPPLLSNTPPPIAEELDDKDEFGDFTIASTDFTDGCDSLSLDTKTLDKDFQDRRKLDGPDVIKILHYNSKINNVTNFQYISDVPPDDDRHDINPESEIELDINNIHAITDCDVDILNDFEVPSLFEEHISVDDNNCLPHSNEPLENITNDFKEIVIDDPPKFNDDICNVFNDAAASKLDTDTTSQLNDDEFGDFDCFPNTEVVCEPEASNVAGEDTSESATEFGDFENVDFGAFSNSSIQPTFLKTFTDLHELETIIIDIFPIHETELTNNYEDEDFTITDFVFNKAKDITDTNALSYQWPKSRSQYFLLQSLNIDMRNILYGPRWNESMPRYAATLGFTPLEPTKTELPSPTVLEPPTQASTSQALTSETLVTQPTSDIPSAQFDWVGSGLVNPLEITPKESVEKDNSNTSTVSIVTPPTSTSNFPSLIPQETQVLDNDSVKSLHLTETEVISSVDDEFEEFTSYQIDKKIESVPSRSWSDKSIPLRETHIANQDSDDSKINEEPGWLKPTILTPVLCRKEEQSTHFTNDELLEWLQHQTDDKNKEILTVNTVEQSTENKYTEFTSIIQPSSDVNQIESLTPTERTDNLPISKTFDIKQEDPTKFDNSSDDDFADFQSSGATVLPQQILPIQPTILPLTPDILQPVKVASSSAVIDWPDPGITDEELKRFEMIYQPINNQISAGDDDEWSDFVSNQAPTELRNSHSEEVTSNKDPQIQSKISENGIHSHTNDDMDDEWSDFVSGPPVLPNGIHTQPQKINFDINRPPQFTSWTSSFTPNIITNPVAFDSLKNYNPPPHVDLLKPKSTIKKPPNVILQPKKNTIPSISSIPDLDFIVPKSHTWKK